MKSPFSLLTTFVILHSSFVISHAAPPPELTILRTQYEKVLAERVTAPFDSALEALNTKFSAALDKAAADAKKAGRLDDVLAILDDQKRLAGKLPIPEDSDSTLAALKPLRTIYREQLQKLEAVRAANHSALLPAYTAKLQTLEVTLTKSDRIDEAKEIKSYRDGLSVAMPAAVVTPGTAAESAAPVASRTSRSSRVVQSTEERQVALAALELGGFASVTAQSGGKEITIKKPEDMPEGDIQITRLSISHTKPPPKPYKGLDDLAGLQHVKAVNLDNFPVQDDVMDAIGTFPMLEEFYIPYPKGGGFTGAKLGQLVAPEKMRKMSFQKSPVCDKGLEAIGRCVNLEALNLAHAVITDKDLRHLAPLTKLDTLDLRWTDTSIEGLRHLKNLTNLKTLGWAPTPKKGMADFAEVAAMFPLVTEVRLSARTGARSEDFAGIAAFPKLTKVFLEGTIVATAALPGVATVPQLTHLKGYSWDTIEDSELIPLQTCAALVNVDVDSAPKITAKGLMHLSKIPKLQSLTLSRFKSISDADVEAFKSARPDVKVDYRK